MASAAVDDLIAPVLDHLDREDPGDVAGVYVFGSAVVSGLRPDSDVDLLVLTGRSLTAPERAALVELLLAVSGWHGHADRFPEAVRRRPIELTSLVVDDGRSWTDSPRRDFQYGEWLREELMGGHLPLPTIDPDVVLLVATAHTANRALRGPVFDELVAPIPHELLRRAVLAVIPDILKGTEGDERNALLAVSRGLATLETGQIVSKDGAAEMIAPTLNGAERVLLERAREDYLGNATEDWADLTPQVTSLAHSLASRARRHTRA